MLEDMPAMKLTSGQTDRPLNIEDDLHKQAY